MTIADRIEQMTRIRDYYRSRETGGTYDPFRGLRVGADRVLERLHKEAACYKETPPSSTEK